MSGGEALSRNLAALADKQPLFQLPAATSDVVCEGGTWKLKLNGRAVALHSRDAAREADGAVAEVLDVPAPPSLLVVVGLSLGHFLEGLERRGWQGQVLAIEPVPGTIRPLLERRDWCSWIDSGRLRLLAAPDFAGASECWRLFSPVPPPAALVVHPVLEREQPGAVEQARAALQKIRFDAEANAEARRRHGAKYLLNTLRNLSRLEEEADVAALDGAVEGKLAFIAAAGPSLDAALPLLRRAQSSALVIAVDTALRPLLSADVAPHLVVGVDPSESNARHLVDLPPCPDVHLVAEASLDPDALRSFAGRTFLFSVSNHEPWPWLRHLGRQAGTLRAWGSVLTSAFDLAQRMGANPIVFVGADLAFTGERTYCQGTAYEEDWRREAAWGTPAREQWASAMAQWPPTFEADAAGVSARTAPQLVAFRNWLVDAMRRQPQRRFVNATGAGILHGGHLEQMAPDEAVRLLSDTPDDFSSLVRARHRPAVGNRSAFHAETVRLHASVQSGSTEHESLICTWKAFAPGLSEEAIAGALEFGLRTPIPPPCPPQQPGPSYPELGVEPQWLRSIASTLPLAPLTMPSHRLRLLQNGARHFRFRSTTARVFCCALRPQDGAVCEDGKPLRRARDLDHVVPGSYSICRDEVHFRATDDSDPRTNGRHYTVLVPPPVAYVESLPLDEILKGQV
jgi:hypothetical protein